MIDVKDKLILLGEEQEIDNSVKFVATLSNGKTVVEEEGEFKTKPGERKPWVRLCNHLTKADLHLTSLSLNYRGRTIHLPKAKFDRFDMNEYSRAPLFYSLQYTIEGEMSGIGIEQTNFIDLAAHYDDFTVHYIQDITNGSNSWIVITDDSQVPLAPTPRA